MFKHITRHFYSTLFLAKQVDGRNSKLRLTPLQTFAIETRDLLRHLDGCVSLNRFAPHFQQMYGRPCRAADYGFSRISEVIDIISNVAEIRGKGAEKVVVLVDGDDIAVSLNEGKMFAGLKYPPFFPYLDNTVYFTLSLLTSKCVSRCQETVQKIYNMLEATGPVMY